MKAMRMLIIGRTWPEPDSTAAGSRMMQLIYCFKNAGYELYFSSSSAHSDYSSRLKTIDVQVKSIVLNDSSFDVWVRKLKPDLVLFDRFMTEEQYGWRIAENCPEALRILDKEDLHSLRKSREEALKSGKPFEPEVWLRHDDTLRELASIFRSDMSLIISSYEMDLLRQKAQVPESLLWHLPFMIDPVIDSTLPPYENRSGFLVIGNGRHRPNSDSVHWLKEDIWPLIRRELPDTKLYVYGAYLPAGIRALDEPDAGFHVHGKASNLAAVMETARVLLAPLRFGAGIKGKLADSMRFGTPSMTTPIGAEGMHGNMPWSGIIASDPAEMARAAVRLYTDKNLWAKAQKQGAVIINSLYSKATHEATLMKRIVLLREQLPEFRTRNLLGRMLLHHQMASTRYMGKWIEAKNN